MSCACLQSAVTQMQPGVVNRSFFSFTHALDQSNKCNVTRRNRLKSQKIMIQVFVSNAWRQHRTFKLDSILGITIQNDLVIPLKYWQYVI